MSFKFSLTICLSLIFGVAAAAISDAEISAALAAAKVGTSSAVSGEVYVTTSGAERKAQVRDTIRLQDRIVTRDDSALQVLLLDRTTFTVSQNCEMVIDKFVYDPTTSTGEIAATVTRGAMRFVSGNIGRDNPGKASLKTPSATIGIRGTIFETIVGEDAIALAKMAGLSVEGANPETATFVILRGPGRDGNTLDRNGLLEIKTPGGQVILIQPGTGGFAPGNGLAPVGPIVVNQAMEEFVAFSLGSTPNGPSENPLGGIGTGSKESGQEFFRSGSDGPDSIIIGPPEQQNDEGLEDFLIVIPEDEETDPKPDKPVVVIDEGGGCTDAVAVVGC